MSDALGSATTIVGGIIGLAIIAVLAVHPQIVTSFFSGVATDVNAARQG